MKRNVHDVWRPIRTDTGLSSSRSHVNTPLVLIPSTIRNRRFQRRMTHLSFNGALFFWIISALAAGGCRVGQALPPPGPTLGGNKNKYHKKIIPTGEPG